MPYLPALGFSGRRSSFRGLCPAGLLEVEYGAYLEVDRRVNEPSAGRIRRRMARQVHGVREPGMSGDQREVQRNSEDQMLLDFLAAQRASVLAIVAGLDEQAWHRPVLPSGWTPAGMVEHLGGAEWHWFQGVVTNAEPD